MAEERMRGTGNAIIGIVLVVLGLLFLAAQFVDLRLWFGFNFWQYFWPFFVIIPGLGLFAGMLGGGRSASGLAIPGSIVTTVGLILLYQNTTNHWESWAYAWALIFPTAVGLGMFIHGTLSGKEEPARVGRTMLLIGVVVFIAGATFFELVLNISGFARGMVGAIAGPGLLIALGLWLLFRRTSSS